MKFFGMILFALCLSSCATTQVGGRSTANLSPQGMTAVHTTEIVKILDVVRDTAVDAEALKAFPTATTSKVVTWHKAALNTISSVPNGWKDTVLAGLAALKDGLTPEERTLLSPYIDAAINTIKAVIS